MKITNMPVKIDQYLIDGTLTVYETYNSARALTIYAMSCQFEKSKFGMKIDVVTFGFIGDDFDFNRVTLIKTFTGNPSKVQFFSLN